MTRFSTLLEGYINNRLSEPELKEFLLLLEENEAAVEERMLEDLQLDAFKGMTTVQLREEMFSTVRKQVNLQRTKVRSLWSRFAAAASIVLVACLGYFLFIKNDKKNVTPPTIAYEKDKDIKAPSTTRAMITLADGRTVYLDSVNAGQVAVQGNVKLVKLEDGRVLYESASGNGQSALVYNTLTNPRGSKVIDMMLADGSRVWLNAGSSVKYPVAFVGDERRVEIAGEAYFEVKHDATKPFKVGRGEMEVTVLGTHFNVNAYDDEDDIKVTLLEGSVKTSIGNRQSAILKPGQQARVVSNELSVMSGVDIDEVMAWKNGKFIFNKTDVKTTMREIARWYDVDVEYKGEVKGFFNGGISRTENASQVLKMLELTGEVKFKIEGRKIVVMQ